MYKVRRIVDTLKPKGSHMSDPILSPDGKMMWNGLDWVPLPTQSVTTVQDSVVMGDITTQIEHSVHNTYSQDTEKLVRNHLHIVAEKMSQGLFVQSNEMYEKAKQIDYQLATELYNGEFSEIFVRALWEELCSHDMVDFILIGNKISNILKFDENHIETLLLLGEISLNPLNNIGSDTERVETAENAYIRVLNSDPVNGDAIEGLRKVEKSKGLIGSSMRLYLFLAGLLILAYLVTT